EENPESAISHRDPSLGQLPIRVGGFASSDMHQRPSEQLGFRAVLERDWFLGFFSATLGFHPRLAGRFFLSNLALPAVGPNDQHGFDEQVAEKQSNEGRDPGTRI